MRTWAALLAGAMVVGCGSTRSRPSTGCDIDASGCASQSLPSALGGGGGSGTDGGTTLGDGAATSVDVVSGRLLLASNVPRPTTAAGATPGNGWTVAPLVSPTGTTLTAVTDTDGRFSLAGVPVVGGTYILRADPPAGSGLLGAVAEFYPSTGSSTFFAVNDSVFSTAVAATRITASTSLAHIILEAVDGGTRVAGIRVVAAATGATYAYDDASGVLSTGVDRTGALGTAAVLNVDAPAAGRYVAVQLTRDVAGTDAGVATYGVFVLPGHISFVAAPAPP